MAGLSDLYRQARVEMDSSMFDLIAEQFYGIKCFRAYRAQRNNERLREGKLDLPFKLFRYLSYQAFSSGKLDLLFMKGFGALLLECLLQSIQFYINLLRTSCLARRQPLGFLFPSKERPRWQSFSRA